MTRIAVALPLVSLLVLGLVAAAAADDGHRADFALFDGSNPDNGPDAGAVCAAKGSFTYHVTVANWGEAGEVRITYADGDFIRFPIAAGASFSFSQAVGKGRGGEERGAVRVSNGGSAAQLAGALSAVGKKPRCISCDATSSGDAACDAIVPN